MDTACPKHSNMHVHTTRIITGEMQITLTDRKAQLFAVRVIFSLNHSIFAWTQHVHTYPVKTFILFSVVLRRATKGSLMIKRSRVFGLLAHEA